LEGDLPILPPPPVGGHEHAETLQAMIREFITIHYQLACGKKTPTPWTSLATHQLILWDTQMWPARVMVRDPSKIVLNDCRKIVQLWRERQSEGGAKDTFKFKFYPVGDGIQPAIYNTQLETLPTSAVIDTPTVPPALPSPTPSEGASTPTARECPTASQPVSYPMPSEESTPAASRRPPTVDMPSSHTSLPDTFFQGRITPMGPPVPSIPTPAITPEPQTAPSDRAFTPAAEESPTMQTTPTQVLPSIPTPGITPEPRSAPTNTLVSGPQVLTAQAIGRNHGGDKEVESDPTTNKRTMTHEPESDPSTDEDGGRRRIQARLQKALEAQSPERGPEDNHEDLPPRVGRKKTKSISGKKKTKTRKTSSLPNQDNHSTNNDDNPAEEHQLPCRKKKPTRPISPHLPSDSTPIGGVAPRGRKAKKTPATQEDFSPSPSGSDEDAPEEPRYRKRGGKHPAVKRTANINPTPTVPPAVYGF
ncbi:uncharacterized protein LACBIDRAFT_336087, partial [Laccaria bicolor S238N-H82]